MAAVGDLTVAAYVSDGLLDPADDYVAVLRQAEDRAAAADLMVAVEPTSPSDRGRLLGTVTYCLAGTPYADVARPGEAEFRMLAVAPAARGRGVGSALTSWCVARAGADGCSALVLSSLPGMTAAHRVYGRLGFVRAPARDWEPRPGMSLVAYVLAL